MMPVTALQVTRDDDYATMDFNWEMQLVWEMDMQEEHLAIAHRAYELFEMRGREHGHDREDWIRAEFELNLNE